MAQQVTRHTRIEENPTLKIEDVDTLLDCRWRVDSIAFVGNAAL